MVESFPPDHKIDTGNRRIQGNPNFRTGDTVESIREEVSARIVLNDVAFPADMNHYDRRMMSRRRGAAYALVMRVVVAACAMDKVKRQTLRR
jgi:hypothetical protein